MSSCKCSYLYVEIIPKVDAMESRDVRARIEGDLCKCLHKAPLLLT